MLLFESRYESAETLYFLSIQRFGGVPVFVVPVHLKTAFKRLIEASQVIFGKSNRHVIMFAFGDLRNMIERFQIRINIYAVYLSGSLLIDNDINGRLIRFSLEVIPHLFSM